MSEENKEYFIMYQVESTGQFVMWSSLTEEIKTYSYSEKPKHYCYDILRSSGYEATPTDLRKYAEDFKRWNHELKHNDILTIDWTKYYENSGAVRFTFQRLATELPTTKNPIKRKKYDHHEKITKTEHAWMRKSQNGALTYCNPQTTQSYGYDYSLFYPTIFSSITFKIPTTEGKETYLTSLPNIRDIPIGYYRVLITCNNPEFKKVFAYSKDNTYVHTSLYQAMKYKDIYNVSIQLIIDDEPNALLYDKSESGNKIFGHWYETLIKLRERFPKNCLVKHLASSLSGHVTRANTPSKSYEQIIEEGLDVGITYDNDFYILDELFYTDKGIEKSYYKLLNTKNPFHYNIRLMPFLTATARNKIARLAMKDSNNVVRIHTDCVVFSEPQTFEKKDSQLEIKSIKLESKTTGLIDWKNCNGYYNYNYELIKLQNNSKKINDAYQSLQSLF